MALVESQEVSLKISTETLGQSDVSALTERIEALAREGGAAAPAFSALAEEVRRLGQQQVRIDGLQTAIESAKGAYAAVRSARHEVEVLDKALGDAKGAGAGREAIRLLEKELAAANRQLSTTETAWAKQKSALNAARADLKAAGVDTAKLAEEHTRLGNALSAAAQRVDDERAAIAAANPALKTLGSTAEQTAAALGRIGIRSADKIQAEINEINQDLIRLASSAKTSGADFDRAWGAGQKRIAALKAEMNGAVDPFAASMGRAGVQVDSITTKLRPLAAALTAAFSVQQGVQSLVDANLQAERLARSLETIATPALSAREQLGWLREMADRNGVAFDRLSQSFISFAASTRGTALEGEKTREIYDAVVTSMGRMGRSSEEVSRALQAVGQIASKGTVSMEELRGQLAEAMPGALQALARGLGITTEQLIKMTGEGRLLAQDALPALQRELQKTIDATGADRVAGMEAGWSRLHDAISRALDMRQENRDTIGEFLTQLADGVSDLSTRADAAGVAMAKFRAAIQTGDWSAYTAFVAAHTAAVAESNDTAAIAAEQQRILGAATALGAAQAQQSVTSWVALDSAYLQVNASVTEQIALAERNLVARQAEGAAAIALAQNFGTEAEQREAALAAAVGNATALKEVAQQRLAEVEVLKAQLAATQAYMVASGDESAEHKKAVAELTAKITARQADADRATAQAAASRIAAEAARAEADAQADNSKRVHELRAAYEDAIATLETVRRAREANKASAEQLTAAEIAAGRAARGYRDALADEAAAIKANMTVKQAQNQLDQTHLQLSIAVAQRAYEIAKARGEEKEATEALLRIKRLEADLAELQARALQAQAAAEQIAIKNKRALAEATGQLTEQMRAELKAEQLAAEAKAMQGKIAEETALKLRVLAQEGAEAANRITTGMQGAAAATDAVGNAASGAAGEFRDMADAASAASAAAKGAAEDPKPLGTGARAGHSVWEDWTGAELAAVIRNRRNPPDLIANAQAEVARRNEEWRRKQEEEDQRRKQEERDRLGNGGFTRPAPSGMEVTKVVQINLAAPGVAPVAVFAAPNSVDAVIAALEAASMRAN